MSGLVINSHAEGASEPLSAISHVAHADDLEGTIKHGMNPLNNFETFVVGSNNHFAHAAALAVSQSQAKTYNPLFIYGGVGLGKTHLMQAIGQQTVERRKIQKVMYLSSERFIDEFIEAIQHNMLVRFRKRYRQTDVLLIDDVHFLAGKERSQEDFSIRLIRRSMAGSRWCCQAIVRRARSPTWSNALFRAWSVD